MAEIPPPPDELPDGFSLKKEKNPLAAIEEHYKRLVELTDDVKVTYEKLLVQRKRMIRDLQRIERLLTSGPRILILAAAGAITGMGIYHVAILLITALFD